MIHLDTLRALHEHDRKPAAYCATCERWRREYLPRSDKNKKARRMAGLSAASSLLRDFPSGLAGGDRCQTRPSEVPAFDYGFRRRSQPLSGCASGSFELGDAALDRDDFVNIEIDVDGGPVQLTLPADTPGVEIAYILTLVPHMEAGVLELRDPVTGEVVFSLRLVLH